MIHYDDDALRSLDANHPHLQECAECRRRRARPQPTLRALQEQIRSERVVALEHLGSLASLPATAGAVQALTAHAHEQLFRNPPVALRSADEAIRISESLEDYPEPMLLVLRGDAWKEWANVLRVMGRFSEGITALAKAQVYYEKLVLNEPYLAMAGYVWASILRETGHLDEALVLVRNAASTFERYGHDQRARHARNLEASIRFAQGEASAALAIYQELLDRAQERADIEELATLYNNIGAARAELGELDEATEDYLQAIALFDTLEMTSARARARWGLARILITKNETQHAIRWLWQIHNEFTRYAMEEDTALVALDIATALFTIQQEAEATRVLDEVITNYRPETGAGRHARALLERAMKKQPPEPKILGRARKALERSKRSSNRCNDSRRTARGE